MINHDSSEKGLSGRSRGFLLALAVILVTNKSSLASYGGGSGTTQDPYLIYTAAQLNTIALNPADWNKNFKLMADVNLATYTGTQFNCISCIYAAGVFDGNGHTISHFNYSNTINGSYYIGLFSSVIGQVKNLTLTDVNVTGYYAVGALVGNNSGAITNCSVSGGSVTALYGRGGSGGLVGWNEGSIFGCRASGEVNSPGDAGGLAGYNSGGQNLPQINSSSSTAAVTCLASGYHAGGLVGYNEGKINFCYATGSVAGGTEVGGLVGFSGGGSEYGIVSCYSTSPVSGINNVAGLVGYNDCDVIDTFIDGNWVSTCYASPISCCYSSGHVSSAGTNTGGLVGEDAALSYGVAPGTSGSFWDKQTSGQATSAGGTGKTAQEMQTLATFSAAGWDFVDVWGIGEGQTYPFLRSRSAADLNNDNIVNFCDLAIFVQRWLKISQ
jgi:hypothetical protein